MDKQLYDPQNVKIKYTGPLDQFFERLWEIIKTVVRDPNIPSPEITDRPSVLYNALTNAEVQQTVAQLPNECPQTKDFIVTAFFGQSLLKIRSIIDSLERPEGIPEDIIEISLNDMKIFNTMVTLIVMDGIYPRLSPGVGIPLTLRTKARQDLKAAPGILGTTAPVTDNASRFAQLEYILSGTLIPVLNVKDNVRDLLFIGSYFPDLLAASIELAFNPAAPNRAQGARDFQTIVAQMDTYSLFLNLTSLIRPKTPAWLLMATTRVLATLPLVRKSNGVLSLIEFISGVREKPDVNIEDLDKAVGILKAVPKKMNPVEYYHKIGQQLIGVMALHDRATTVSATVHIVDSIYEQKQEMVVVGVQDALLETLAPRKRETVKAEELMQAVRALEAMVRAAQPLGVIHEVGKFAFVALWTLLCFAKAEQKEDLATSVSNVLVGVVSLQPEDAAGIQSMLLRNFLAKSGSRLWEYGVDDEGMVGIVATGGRTSVKTGGEFALFGEIERRGKVLSESILGPLAGEKDTFTSTLFVNLIKEWLLERQEKSSNGEVLLESDDEEDTVGALVHAKLLEILYNEHKDRLIKSPMELLMVIHGTLEDYVSILERAEEKKKTETTSVTERLKIVDLDDSDIQEEKYYPEAVRGIVEVEEPDTNKQEDTEEETEMLDLCFSLVLAITEDLATAFKKVDPTLDDKVPELRSLETVLGPLQYIVGHTPEGLLQGKAAACVDQIAEVLGLYFPKDSTVPAADASEGDRKTLSRVIQMLDDLQAPTQAHGLYILRGLVTTKSVVVRDNWRMATQLCLSKLVSDDAFVYLNAVKTLLAVCDAHDGGDGVVEYLVDVYSGVLRERKDESVSETVYTRKMLEEMGVDELLKVGEVILRVVQRLGEALGGTTADIIAGRMLAMASRRRMRGSIFATRPEGVPDVLRMSALGILGAAYEASFVGVAGEWMDDTLDVALGILSMEGEQGQAVEKDDEDEEKQVAKEVEASGGVMMRRAALALLISVARSVPGPEWVMSDDIERAKVYVDIYLHDRDPIVRSHAEVLDGLLE
ncbi:uncharacterized protein SAPINGB_P000112 [Magnusiomyces paraingens]|uniref:Uncharacterized protein n=1 Tax=Magnusiomyces paraingens TaxID=2606893 RepID=A0A5E8AYG9_9ASCO|nr:uncharacterized protein SAPINGB_P000112 [Saprochaete ingens]VVT43714.1 unnamed protein product [Saprochaete ingens]